VRVGIADHYGWAIAVTADDNYEVVDRRRIELLDDSELPNAPVEHDIKGLADDAAFALVEAVRASALRAAATALEELSCAVPTIASIALRAWPPDFPDDIATKRRAPYDTRADGIMYRQVLAEAAEARGWEVHLYDAKHVEGQASAKLGARAADVLYGPRAHLGAPWAKDHRTALAAIVVC